jgi:MFS family permease
MSPAAPAPFAPAERRQLFRFCLYGFLKNQQYYEPFLFLAFLDKGLSPLRIGTLLAFSQVCIMLIEIPTGAVADVWGRRRTMIASFAFYIAAFSALAFTDSYWALFPAMSLFAAGEAFREGTHKAMIFDWLTRLGRGGEKTRVYGITRSWSKLGSALNAIIIATRQYRWVFLLSVVPFALNIVNLFTYPKYLDGEPRSGRSVRDILRMLWAGLRLIVVKKQLRSLVVESMCFEGVYEAARSYLQPLLKAVAVAALAALAIQADKQEMIGLAVLTAAVGVPLSLLSSLASRHSHRASASCGGDDRLAFRLWVLGLVLYLLTGAALALGAVGGTAAMTVAILGFVAMTVIQNIWRPTLVSRYYCHAETGSAATTLSVESMAKSVTVVVAAPLLGWLVGLLAGPEAVRAKNLPMTALWPVAAVGAAFCLVGLVVNLRTHRQHWGNAGGPAEPAGGDQPAAD